MNYLATQRCGLGNKVTGTPAELAARGSLLHNQPFFCDFVIPSCSYIYIYLYIIGQ